MNMAISKLLIVISAVELVLSEQVQNKYWTLIDSEKDSSLTSLNKPGDIFEFVYINNDMIKNEKLFRLNDFHAFQTLNYLTNPDFPWQKVKAVSNINVEMHFVLYSSFEFSNEDDFNAEFNLYDGSEDYNPFKLTLNARDMKKITSNVSGFGNFPHEYKRKDFVYNHFWKNVDPPKTSISHIYFSVNSFPFFFFPYNYSFIKKIKITMSICTPTCSLCDTQWDFNICVNDPDTYRFGCKATSEVYTGIIKSSQNENELLSCTQIKSSDLNCLTYDRSNYIDECTSCPNNLLLIINNDIVNNVSSYCDCPFNKIKYLPVGLTSPTCGEVYDSFCNNNKLNLIQEATDMFDFPTKQANFTLEATRLVVEHPLSGYMVVVKFNFPSTFDTSKIAIKMFINFNTLNSDKNYLENYNIWYQNKWWNDSTGLKLLDNDLHIYECISNSFSSGFVWTCNINIQVFDPCTGIIYLKSTTPIEIGFGAITKPSVEINSSANFKIPCIANNKCFYNPDYSSQISICNDSKCTIERTTAYSPGDVIWFKYSITYSKGVFPASSKNIVEAANFNFVGTNDALIKTFDVTKNALESEDVNGKKLIGFKIPVVSELIVNGVNTKGKLSLSLIFGIKFGTRLRLLNSTINAIDTTNVTGNLTTTENDTYSVTAPVEVNVDIDPEYFPGGSKYKNETGSENLSQQNEINIDSEKTQGNTAIIVAVVISTIFLSCLLIFGIYCHKKKQNQKNIQNADPNIKIEVADTKTIPNFNNIPNKDYESASRDKMPDNKISVQTTENRL